MMRNTIGAGAVLAVGVLLLAGCATGASGSSDADSAVGTWTAAGSSAPEITLADDGTFTGNDGCVGFDGTWSVDGDTITVDLLKAPAKACPGVDQWLQQAKTFTVSGDELHAVGAGGEALGSLPKNS